MLKEKKVVSCFIEHRGRLLLLRRSARVGTYRGKWATVSGYLEKPPDEQALTELKEELGLLNRDVKLVKRGEPLEIKDRELMARWLVHPYLFSLKDCHKINTDWEHQEYKWVLPREIINYDTVPGLNEALARVYPV